MNASPARACSSARRYSMGVALELLRFSSRRAEVRYQLQLSHRLASADANAYFAHASLLFGGMMIIGLREG